ncbi:hypothetical protein HPB48_017243 [Haemaphysalis longicornis]|uniref:Transposase Helix-turn-helix domain-containing protein n=1 Tax=Haemaphysalis longicornis TaxID=44386 RepID=A0A9J6H4N9_HAELO|nr:hypothetical protein HPB48_017243 [Haemaphysalis longicornis]
MAGPAMDGATHEADLQRRRRKVIAALLCLRAQRRNRQAQHESRLAQLRAALRSQAAVTSDLEEQLRANTFAISTMVVANLPTVQRERWAFQRNEKWFEETLPKLGELHFRQSLRVTPATFRYIVDALRCVLERETTNMREAISVEKRVAIGLYRLRSSAEDQTIAHLFGVGRSTVNLISKEFFAAVIEVLEVRSLCMMTRKKCRNTYGSSTR